MKSLLQSVTDQLAAGRCVTLHRPGRDPGWRGQTLAAWCEQTENDRRFEQKLRIESGWTLGEVTQ